MTATRKRTMRPLRPAQQAIIERWKPSIDALIEANWPRLEQIGLDTAGPLAGPWGSRSGADDRRFLISRVIEDHYGAMAQSCHWDAHRRLCRLYGHNLLRVLDLYSDLCDWFMAAQDRAPGAPVEPPSLLAFEQRFPVRPQAASLPIPADQAGQACLWQHCAACSHCDHPCVQSCVCALIPKYLEYLAQIHTGNQNHPFPPSVPAYHGIPVLVCQTCQKTPLQCFEPLHLMGGAQDRQDAITAIQLHIESML